MFNYFVLKIKSYVVTFSFRWKIGNFWKLIVKIVMTEQWYISNESSEPNIVMLYFYSVIQWIQDYNNLTSQCNVASIKPNAPWGYGRMRCNWYASILILVTILCLSYIQRKFTLVESSKLGYTPKRPKCKTIEAEAVAIVWALNIARARKKSTMLWLKEILNSALMHLMGCPEMSLECKYYSV